MNCLFLNIPGKKNTFRRKAVIVLAILVIFPVKNAESWGAFRGINGSFIANTHQLILREAFNLLMNDPAAQNPAFFMLPGQNRITIFDLNQYEGVEADVPGTLADFAITLTGTGPDADGASPYSYHWFNPTTGMGNAPKAAGKFYMDYLNMVFGSSINMDEAVKGLSWSAHFLADMFVPYHLNGIPGEEAVMNYSRNKFTLDLPQSGPLYLFNRSFSTAGPDESLFDSFAESKRGFNGNFQETYIVFMNARSSFQQGNIQNPIDWFDPWYWNGYIFKAPMSSHASWEKKAHDLWIAQGGNYFESTDAFNYDMDWENARPDYGFSGFYAVKQAGQVEKFCSAAASRIKNNLKASYLDPVGCIQKTIRAVYTLLRSATTALYPEIVDVYPDPDPSRKGNLIFEVRILNFATEACENVTIKCSAYSASDLLFQRVGAASQTLEGFGQGNISRWSVPLSPEKEWNIHLEVTGEFKKTPDLQYASCSHAYQPSFVNVIPEQPQQGVFGQSSWSPGSLTGDIYFLGPETTKLPDFDNMQSMGHIYTTTLNVPETRFESGFPGVTNRYEYFGISYKGQIFIRTPGVYQFRLTSDDGSRLLIDEALVVNNDNIHSIYPEKGSIELQPGVHNIRIDYFQGPKFYVALILEVRFPGTDKFEIFDMTKF